MFDLKISKGKTNSPQDYFDIAKVVLSDQKTKDYQGGYGVFTNNALEVKNMMEKIYDKRMVANQQPCAFHIIITFTYIAPDVTLDKLYEYMEHVSDVLGVEHQVVFGIHHNNFNVDAKTLQIHLLLNAVTWRNDVYPTAAVLSEDFVDMKVSSALYQAAAYMANPLLKIETTLSYSDRCFA